LCICSNGYFAEDQNIAINSNNTSYVNPSQSSTCIEDDSDWMHVYAPSTITEEASMTMSRNSPESEWILGEDNVAHSLNQNEGRDKKVFNSGYIVCFNF
jgi:hypothetical protein